MSGEYPNAVDDHPRKAEVEQIWHERNRLRPKEALGDGKIVITDQDFSLPVCLLSDILVPAVFLEGRSEDQIAFGVAYATCLSVGLQYIEDGVSLLKGPGNGVDEDSLLAMPTSVLFGMVGGLLGGFMSLAGWFENHKQPSPDPDLADRLRLGATALVIAPFFGAVAAVQKDDPPMMSAVDRAAAVRAACVALGVHR